MLPKRTVCQSDKIVFKLEILKPFAKNCNLKLCSKSSSISKKMHIFGANEDCFNPHPYFYLKNGRSGLLESVTQVKRDIFGNPIYGYGATFY